MPLDFPSSPTNGQYYNGFVWNAANETWDSAYAPRAATIPISSPNYIINGAMDIWQRGTSGFAVNAFTADRWINGNNAGTNAVTQSTDVPAGIAAKYSIQVAGTSTTNPQIYQKIESLNSVGFAGQTVTLSVYAKSTVGTSPLAWVALYPTSTTPDDFSAGVTSDQGGTFSASPAGSWTRYTATFTVSANAVRGYQIIVYRNSTTTSTTTLYTGIQLEVGAAATDFRRNQPNIQAELAACQRYYWEARRGDVQGISTSDRAVGIWVNFPVTMRTTPTVTFSSGTFPYWAIDNEGAFGWGGMSIKTTTAKSVMWDAGIWPTINDYYPVSILGGFVTYISAEL